jgi:CRISPR-associated endonuclease/helicase Cas3
MKLSSRITTSTTSREIPNSKQPSTILVDSITVDDLAQRIKTLSEGKGNIAIICNTVKNAHIITGLMKAHFDNVILAHSRFTAIDRMENDTRLLALLNKQAPPPETTQIVVGTQVIEQSLDIDFDYMISELAPMDSLLQRMGRLHRHSHKNRSRPTHLAIPRFTILNTEDDMLLSSYGSERIYGSYRLQQTKAVLNSMPDSSIKLPDDISTLMEKAYSYHEEAWDEEKEQYTRKQEARKQVTKNYMIAAPDPGKDKAIYGWLEGGVDTELSGQSRVRDGISGPTVIAVFTDEKGLLYVPYYTRDGVRKNQLLTQNDEVPYEEALKILANTITLPMSYIAHVETLEHQMMFTDLKTTWKKNSLLSGELAVVFDKDDKFSNIKNHPISYSITEGLIG